MLNNGRTGDWLMAGNENLCELAMNWSVLWVIFLYSQKFSTMPNNISSGMSPSMRSVLFYHVTF